MEYCGMIQEAAQFIRTKVTHSPKIALILGSGLGDLAERLEDREEVSYADIPHFPVSKVKGHAAKLVFGTLEGRELAVMQGRFHFYEGYTMKQVVFPLFVLHALGAEDLLVTNACGGISRSFQPGDLMLIEDHINLLGNNPLIGDNDERLGPRFPDMTEVYSRKLIAHAEKTAAAQNITLQKGVYALFSGPCYETAAEIRAYAALGADAIGMSTVPEATAARYLGMRTLGISCITNMATGIAEREHSHEAVLKVASESGERLGRLCEAMLKKWPE